MKELLDSFEKSLAQFSDILSREKNVANRDSAIKRFELTTELAWKTVQKYLRSQNIVCRSPKECAREAFKMGLVEDDAKWVSVFEDRNLTVHTYDEKFADEIYERLPDYLKLLSGLYDKLAVSINKAE